MALDKCYIDLQCDSVIAPAMAYYSRKGSPDDRLKAYYYRARISDNAGKPSEALHYAAKAREYVGEATDNEAIARLYSFIGRIYALQFDFERALENDLLAKEYYDRACSAKYSFKSGIKICNDYNLLGDYEAAFDVLKSISTLLNSVGARDKSTYYDELLNLSDDIDSVDADDVIRDYLSCVPERNVSWLKLSNSYYQNGQYEEAYDAMLSFSKFNPSSLNTETYYHHLADALAGLGKDGEALEAYKTFLDIWGENTDKRISGDTRFVEERFSYEKELLEARHKRDWSLLLMIIVALTALSIVLSIIARLRRERMERVALALRYDTLLQEKEALSGILSNTGDASLVAIIEDRLALIDKLLIAEASRDEKLLSEAERCLDEMISDRQSFVSSTVKLVQDKNPKFIASLRKSGLNEEEQGICCLYTLGLNGKSVKQLTGSGRHYQKVSEIRSKLGLGEHDTNIDRYINTLYNS